LSDSTTSLPQPVVTAGFGIRTIAYLLDALILSFCGGAFPYLVIATYNGGPSGNTGQQATTSASGSLLISLVYFVFFWSRLGGGRTLGMRLFRLRVVQEEDMASPGIFTALIRWFGLWLSFACCFLGVIWVAFDSRHQGWHDKIARTLVVRT
jgi:uncharacterized RDD family membrane protein YckC